ncbi:RabGAP/TBC [Fomitopsis betulina]|nr:RabGAP/TBC [Fomitopsis betulina]
MARESLRAPTLCPPRRPTTISATWWAQATTAAVLPLPSFILHPSFFMDAPAVLVVPATPIDPFLLPLSPPSSSAATTPDLSVDDRRLSLDRGSSETTIVTIYSIWSASPSMLHPGKDNAVDVAVLGVDRRTSTPRWSRPVEDSGYFEDDPLKRASVVDKVRQSVVSTGSRPLSQARSSKTHTLDARHFSNGSAQPSPSDSGRTDGTTRPLSSSPSRPTSAQPNTRPGSASPHLSPASTPPPQALSLLATPPRSPPAPDEDPDSFHLDLYGGVERTRARLRAQEALADAHEKTRDLTQQEVTLLASLDRYGFYVIPSHDRSILLLAVPLLKPLAKLGAANTNGPASPPLLQSQAPLTPPPKERAWGIRASKERKLRARTFKGIPDCWRSAAWDTLLCRFSRHGKVETRQLSQEYRDGLDRPSTYDVQIDLDVPGRLAGTQRSLFHVLHSFSLRCETCGYCQGMGPLAATLLCYFEPERVYASLVRLHDAYQMHTIFSPGFPGLLEAIYVQERIMEQLLPPVYAAFKKHMISTTSYATKWYITLFANSVPFQTQLRLWDAFLLEGHDIFVVVAVAIVWVYRDHITSASASFETVLSLLSSFFVPEDENALLSWIEKVISDKKLRTNMLQWRRDWQRLVETGEEGSALL